MQVTLGIHPSAESGLPPVDVVVRARPDATVRDLAGALVAHLAPDRAGQYLVPCEEGQPLPAGRRLAECGLRTGDVLTVVGVPPSWAHQPGRPSRRLATARVVAGPDAGTVVALTTSSVTIGRAAGNTIPLTDPLVSRHHARILLAARPTVVDDGSAHGTTVDGVAVNRPVECEWGTRVGVGDSLIVVEPADTRVDPDAGTRVLRPPRFGESPEPEVVDVPAPPAKPKPPMMPWPMMLLPLVLGLSLFGTGRSLYALLYILGYPLILLATHVIQRRQQKREHAKELKVWREDLDTVYGRLDVHAAAQRDRAVADHPDPAVLVTRVLTCHHTLWGRQEGDPDFLAGRVGRGPVLATLSGKLADGGDREPALEARREFARRRVLHDEPVPAAMAAANVVAIAGGRDDVDAVARALVIRLCCDHSPTDVAVTAVLGPRRAHHETWLRWLPHAAPRLGGIAPVAIGAADGHALLDRLAADATNGRGHVVCLLDADAGVARRTVESVAAVAAAAAANAAPPGTVGTDAVVQRLHLVWLGDDPTEVPAATDILVDLTASVPDPLVRADLKPAATVAQIARRDRGGVDPLTSVDQLDLVTVWRMARAMIRYTDDAAVLPADTALPETVRLPDLTSDMSDPDDVAGVLQRWQSSQGLRAQIGMGVDNVTTLDLRDDGPHGLVAGTTGSGKSELLQTLLCALALNNPPSRISFLLVDYKGGAAFRECADLPHTVGYITDLTPALVQRALTSLGAEITAREHLLARHGAKDLVALEREHPEAAPPSLLICVDEFAALTAEVPEFVDGMVNIAQRGRSLGMHLLLATQRPAGVVTANIRANTDLRIALRVASDDDSSDVLDRPDAARISRRTPGRAWVRRTGHGTADLVQVAWVGAREPLAATMQPVTIEAFTARTRPADTASPTGPDGADSGSDARVHARTDLDRLVGTIGEAFVRSGTALPPRPWLPPLPPELLLGCRTPGELLCGPEVPDAESLPELGSDVLTLPADSGRVPIGLVDAPANRSQPPVVLDYPQVGHVLVYGASGSGKTELLRTVAVAATLAVPPGDPTPLVYAIDCAGGALSVLGAWPTIAAVVPEAQLTRVMRLIRLMQRTVASRNALLAENAAADIGALAAQTGRKLPRIHILIDNLPALDEALSGTAVTRSHLDKLATILTEGRRVGVHVTATSLRRIGVPVAMQAAFGQRLVLRMTVDDDYGMLGAPAGLVTVDSPPGRGLLGRSEIQVATIGGAGTAAQADRLRALGSLVAERVRQRPPVGVPLMPGRLTDDMVETPRRDRLPLYLDADHVGVVGVPLLSAPLLVAGRGGTGRTSALAGIAALARRSDQPPDQIVLVGPRAGSAPGQANYDRVVTDLADLAAWLPEWRDDAAGQGGAPDRWRLLLVDDAHEWERQFDTDMTTRTVLGQLADLVTDAGTAVVVAADSDEARTRQHITGITQAVRRSRRGFLLQPDFADGGLFGVTVPSHTIEPLTGPGRGLYVSGGSVTVAQLLSCQPTDQAAETSEPPRGVEGARR